MTDLSPEAVERLDHLSEGLSFALAISSPKVQMDTEDAHWLVSQVRALAAENARLRTALVEARAALKPFSDATQWIEPEHNDDYSPSWAEFFVVGDFRKAATALSPAATASASLDDATAALSQHLHGDGEWKGPGEKPHRYSPDYMALGDCQVCGHTAEAHNACAAQPGNIEVPK